MVGQGLTCDVRVRRGPGQPTTYINLASTSWLCVPLSLSPNNVIVSSGIILMTGRRHERGKLKIRATSGSRPKRVYIVPFSCILSNFLHFPRQLVSRLSQREHTLHP